MGPLLNIEPRQVLLGVGPKEKFSIMITICHIASKSGDKRLDVHNIFPKKDDDTIFHTISFMCYKN